MLFSSKDKGSGRLVKPDPSPTKACAVSVSEKLNGVANFDPDIAPSAILAPVIASMSIFDIVIAPSAIILDVTPAFVILTVPLDSVNSEDKF